MAQSDEGTTPFTHIPLNQDIQEIRLIKISSRNDESSPMNCTIRHVDLAEVEWKGGDWRPFPEPEGGFLALSYAWGPPSPTQAIFLRGKPFIIRQNLYDFLATISLNGMFTEQWFWIDQISINQNCTEERNHQVQHMAEIYKRARKVLVWLGVDVAGVNDLFDSMRKTVSPREIPYSFGETQVRELIRAGVRAHTAAWSHITSLDYWRRLWVHQEIALGGFVDVLMGGSMVPWSQFHPWFRPEVGLGLHDTESWTLKRVENLEASRNLWQPWKRLGNYSADALRNSGLPWTTALLHTSDTVCSEPLDRIFALLGLVSPARQINVDYSYTRMQLYAAVIAAWQRWDDLCEEPTVLCHALRLDDEISDDEVMETRRELYVRELYESRWERCF